jgi:hypothetical protein
VMAWLLPNLPDDPAVHTIEWPHSVGRG